MKYVCVLCYWDVCCGYSVSLIILVTLTWYVYFVVAVRFHQTVWFFMPPPVSDRCGGGIMFSGCPSVSACVRPGVRPVSNISNQRTEFHQTLVDDVVWGTDELIRFWRSKSQGQGHSKVRYLSELLLRADTYTSTFGHVTSVRLWQREFDLACPKLSKLSLILIL